MTKPNDTITLTQEQAQTLSFCVTCYLDDEGKDILRRERNQGARMPLARTFHAKAQKIQLIKLNPEALCGELKLMDGTVIEPAPTIGSMHKNKQTGSVPHTTILIPTQYYDKLKLWCSVGRTIDTSIELLSGLAADLASEGNNTANEESANAVIEELTDLKQCLDACNTACKENFYKTGV